MYTRKQGMGASRNSGGLGCTSCGGGCGADQGMGFFASADPSTWGFAEWGTVGAVVLIGAKVLGSHPAVKSAGKRSRKAAAGATSGLGSVVLYGGLAYAAYWAYTQYIASNAAGLSGLGDYQSQGYTQPQILKAPLVNADVQIPMGWGGGLGDYQPQGYTQPQILTAPLVNADVDIPMGWS